jgi:hypothetical protein
MFAFLNKYSCACATSAAKGGINIQSVAVEKQQ